MEKILREKQQSEKQRNDRLIQTLSQAVTTTVNARIDKAVKSEMKSAVIPSEEITISFSVDWDTLGIFSSPSLFSIVLPKNMRKICYNANARGVYFLLITILSAPNFCWIG